MRTQKVSKLLGRITRFKTFALSVNTKQITKRREKYFIDSVFRYSILCQ